MLVILKASKKYGKLSYQLIPPASINETDTVGILYIFGSSLELSLHVGNDVYITIFSALLHIHSIISAFSSICWYVCGPARWLIG